MRTLTQTLWIGVWLCIIPFLGVPGAWKERLVVLTGLYLVFCALRAYYTSRRPRSEPQAHTPRDAEAASSMNAPSAESATEETK